MDLSEFIATCKLGDEAAQAEAKHDHGNALRLVFDGGCYIDQVYDGTEVYLDVVIGNQERTFTLSAFADAAEWLYDNWYVPEVLGETQSP